MILIISLLFMQLMSVYLSTVPVPEVLPQLDPSWTDQKIRISTEETGQEGEMVQEVQEIGEYRKLGHALGELLGTMYLDFGTLEQVVNEYVEKEGLRSKVNRNLIVCNEKLENALGVKKMYSYTLKAVLEKATRSVKKRKLEEAMKQQTEFLANRVIPLRKSEKVDNLNTPSSLLKINEALRIIVRAPYATRNEVMKAVWDYVFDHKLMVSESKTLIRCDSTLQAILGKSEIHMFQIDGIIDCALQIVSDEAEKKLAAEYALATEKKVDYSVASQVESEESANDEPGSQLKNGSLKRKRTTFSKPFRLSLILQTVLGVKYLSRGFATKALWIYIKKYNLQDPNDKRNIICDQKLKALFQIDSVGMFQMAKLLGSHLHVIEDQVELEEAWRIQENFVASNKFSVLEDKKQNDAPKRGKKRKAEAAPIATENVKKKRSVFSKPSLLNEALAELLGVQYLSRGLVTKALWVYFKKHNLQDLKDKRTIICDAKLKRVFGTKKVGMFQIAKLLGSCLTPITDPTEIDAAWLAQEKYVAEANFPLKNSLEDKKDKNENEFDQIFFDKAIHESADDESYMSDKKE